MTESGFGLFEEYWGKLSFIERACVLYSRFCQISRLLAFWVIFSVIFHLIILGVLVHSHSLRNSPGEKRGFSLADYEAFSQALSVLRTEMNEEVKETSAPMPVLSEEEIATLLAEAPSLDPQFKKRERVEIFYELLKSRLGREEGRSASMQTSRAGRRSVLDSGTRFFDSGPYASGRASLYKISPEIMRQLSLLRRSEKWEHEETLVRGGYVRVQAETGTRDIPVDYYFRDCPYEEILTVGEKAFYFVSGFPVQDPSGDFERNKVETGRVLSLHPEKDFAVFLLKSAHLKPATTLLAKRQQEPLVLGPGELERILDELMELPEEEQFSRFVSNYLERYDPDEGDLAVLAREFMHRNLGTIFIITSPFAAAFDFLEEIYFNKRTQGYLETYWRKKRGTKTAAEIIFIIAGLIDFEKRTLGYFFCAYESALRVLTSGERKSDVFNQKAKAFVLKETMEGVLEAMEKAGIQSEEELIKLYEDAEASLYGLLTEGGGETRDRALFALGCLHWNSGRHKEAVSTWKSIRSSYERRTFREMRRQIESFERMAADGPVDYSLIDSRVRVLLSKEDNNQSNKQLRRLIKYRKWSLRYAQPARKRSAY